MYTSNFLYGSQFNPQVLKDLKKINDELEDEKSQAEPDNEKILKLREKQLMRGMELQSTYFNNFRRNIPW
jgi:hypothetical protein